LIRKRLQSDRDQKRERKSGHPFENAQISSHESQFGQDFAKAASMDDKASAAFLA
jgi:hypothetical protein